MIQVILSLSPLLLVGLVLAYHASLRRVLSESPTRPRALRPGLAWLGLLPGIGIVWHVALAILLVSDLRRRCAAKDLRCHGAALMALGVAGSLSIGSATLPLLGPSLALFGAPLWLLFWWRLASHGSRLRRHAAGDAAGVAAILPPPSANAAQGVARRTRLMLLWACFAALGIAVAAWFVSDYRLTIWQDSGLWTEPVERIRGLQADKIRFRIVAIVLAAATAVGWVWASRKKKLLLFLRKFRQDDINRALQQAVRKRLHGEFRLVTLDDATFHPITSSRAAQVAGAAAMIAAVAVWFATRDMVREYVEGGLRGFAQAEGLLRQSALSILLVPLIEPEGMLDVLGRLLRDPLGAGAALYVDEMQYPMFFLGGFGTAYFGLAIFLAVVGVLYAVALVRLRLIGRSAIGDLAALARFDRHAKGLQQRLRAPTIVSPPATVVSVDSRIWQDAVLTLAATADVVLFDLSDYSVNIAWEIEQMSAQHAAKLVLVAQRQRFLDWTLRAEQGDDLALRHIAQAVTAACPILYEAAKSLDLVQLTRRLNAVRPDAYDAAPRPAAALSAAPPPSLPALPRA